MQRCRRNLSIKAEQEKNGNLKLNQESSKVSVHEEKNSDEYSICSARFSNLFHILLENSKIKTLAVILLNT